MMTKEKCTQHATEFKSLWTSDKASEITEAICATYQDHQGINHIDEENLPQSKHVLKSLELLTEIIFPGYTGKYSLHRAGLTYSVGNLVNEVRRTLTNQITRAFAYRCKMDCCEGCNCMQLAEEAVIRLLCKLPDIRETLKKDVQAALDGDPATASPDEIVISYPGMKTITIQRLAHELYHSKVPLIPRIMTEFAHAETGIDIHPGAHIGESFFIDHGTGVVIGETCKIGENVKIYQGVTLGALSFPKDACGKLIKGAKRHPDIEDDVTIYAGATILGNITIGKGSIIGGNVWLTESVPEGTKITIAPPDLSIKTRSSSMK